MLAYYVLALALSATAIASPSIKRVTLDTPNQIKYAATHTDRAPQRYLKCHSHHVPVKSGRSARYHHPLQYEENYGEKVFLHVLVKTGGYARNGKYKTGY
ncbi:hypothetical protein SeLEV6574_g03936 [Synchytrium endobioticum]|nr:hypothetical protein SeLEV6574_g03936 [Synchytrium endobioticum]